MRRSRLAAKMVFLALVLIWCVPIQTMAADRIVVSIDGHSLDFDVQPVLIDGTTLVQVRPIMEKLGLDIGWDGDSQTVSGSWRGSPLFQLTVGNRTALIDGVAKQLEIAPRLIDGYTFVPLRLIGEATGRVVVWSGLQQAVYIYTPLSAYIREQLLDKTKLKYEGETLGNGVWNGQGKLYADGVKLYDGELKNGRLNGYGFLYRVKDGSLLYAGNFADNAPEGEGVRYLQDGSKYTGAFAGGRQSGSGSLLDGDGSLLFQGKWKDDLKNGEGATYRKGRVIEQGVYVDGRLWEGRSVRTTFKNGDSAVDVYEKGVPAKREMTDISGSLVFAGKDVPDTQDRELQYASETQRVTFYFPAYWRGKIEVTEKERQITVSYKAPSGERGMLAEVYVYTEDELRQWGGEEEIPYSLLGSANGRYYFYTTASENPFGYEAGSADSEAFFRLQFGVPYVIDHIRFNETVQHTAPLRPYELL
ncbi:stalk domain-containing protein [Paenibacillus sp. MBLB4367]|uniref:stalk domain-containing protein n=1 Tax=Paenibacillus sp. MBLB4367 TaxID=3384767 RepID=UPI0039080F02